MLTKKIYLTILIYLILVSTVLAQFDVRLTSGFGIMYLKPITSLNLNIKSENFVTVGIQSDYYITDNVGLGIGADYYIQKSKFDIQLLDYSHSYKGIDNWEADPDPRAYEFTIKSNAPEIVEQNTMSFLEFPVSVIYRFPLIKKTYLATRLGLKVGIPINGTYVLRYSDLYTRLYFEEWDLELFNIPAHGSEVGLDFPVSLLKVRVSGYFSYGLNNTIDEHQSSLIYWREKYNYILSLPESVNMMQIGVKLGIGITKTTKCAWEYH